MGGQHKDTRLLDAAAYLRLWGYLNAQDRVYVVCWFHAFHEGANASPTSPVKALFLQLFSVALSKLGVAGKIASALLDYWLAIKPKDIFECEKVLGVTKPGPSSPRR